MTCIRSYYFRPIREVFKLRRTALLRDYGVLPAIDTESHKINESNCLRVPGYMISYLSRTLKYRRPT